MNKKHTRRYGVNFELDQSNFTAKIIYSPNARGEILFPRSIDSDSHEFIITSIAEGTFENNNHIVSIEFVEDSELTLICANAFANSSLERLSFPSKLKDLEDGWCSNTINLNKIKISPNNQHFTSLNNEMIIGRSNTLNDILIFAPRNIKEAFIPSFIRHIGPYAFSECKILFSVYFEENSELLTIGKNSFSSALSLKQISIPPTVIEIGEFAFFQSEKLEKVEFSENSELRSIGQYAFSKTSIKSFTIPGKLEELNELWNFQAMLLRKVNISPRNENFSYLDQNGQIIIQNNNTLTYVDCLTQNVIVPTYITKINSFAFTRCCCLQSVIISEGSQLRTISKFAFSNSTIKMLSIPSSIEKLEDGWCFDTPKLTKIVISPKNRHFSCLGQTMVIGKTSDSYDVIHFVNRDAEKVSIPSFIKHISPYSFSDCSLLKSVVFTSDSQLVSIGKNAFADSSIEKVSIPTHVKKIDEFAFNCCSKLTSVHFTHETELEIIDKEAFSHSAVVSMRIPSHVKQINESAFSSCKNLAEIEFDENSELEIIDKKAFFMVPISSIKIPSSVKLIGELAFFNCGQLREVMLNEDSQLQIIGKSCFSHSAINSIFIPRHVKEIKEAAFFKCQNFETINFSEDSELEVIEKESFLRTSITSILIPKQVRIIGESAFSESLIENVDFEKDSKLEVIGQDSFSSTGIEMIRIPNHVKEIEESSFHYCCRLHTIEFDNENSELRSINGFAFSDSTLENLSIPANVNELKSCWCCGTTELMNITISPKNKYYKILNDNLVVSKTNVFLDVLNFASRIIKKVVIPAFIKKIDSFAFSGCQTLQTVEFEEGSELVLIDKYAFSDSAITEISLPIHLKMISESAFSDCGQLTAINISDDSELETIDKYAFSDTQLNYLNFPNNLKELKTDWCTEISDLCNIYISPNNQYFTHLDEDHKIIIGRSDLDNDIYDTIIFACRDINYAFIPSFIKEIGVSSFNSCLNLEKIEFSENSSIKIINKNAFSRTNIRSITIPSSVKRIGEQAFYDCPQLENIKCPEDSDLSVIEKIAFSHTSVKRIVIPKLVNQLKEGTFTECKSLKTIEFLGDYVNIEANCFRDNSSLLFISFPNANRVFISKGFGLDDHPPIFTQPGVIVMYFD